MTEIKESHLVFIHIPKTAGTFIRNGLQRHYGKIGQIYPSAPFETFKNMGQRELHKLQHTKILVGHESFHAFEHHLVRPAKYFTILRNPVDRLLSYYNHAMTNFTQFENKKVTPLKFLQNTSNYETDNLQLRYLSGKPVTKKVDQDDLEHAKLLIQQGKVTIGIQEHLAESLARMSLFKDVKFDLRKPANTSTFGFSRHSLTVDEIKALRARSYWDFKLYQYALEYFESTRR